MEIEVLLPSPTADDTFHALGSGLPPLGSFLCSLGEFGGQADDVCVFEFPGIGPVRVPGLAHPLFACRTERAFDALGQECAAWLVRLPPLYVHLNQGLKALMMRLRGVTDVPYDWGRLAADLCDDLAALGARILESRCYRPRLGAGMMGLAQANPNLRLNEVGMGLDLAADLLRVLQRKRPGEFETVESLAGLVLDVDLRQPVTTPDSARTDMHLVLSGRGKALHHHPYVLKVQMEGDVDGDLLFSLLSPSLRRQGSRVYVPLPDTVSADHTEGDYSLGDVGHVAPADRYGVYEGLKGKNEIGPITNLFYRLGFVLQIVYGQTPEARAAFWARIGSVPRHGESGEESAARKSFREHSTRALMAAFHPFYETVFDLRKDQTNLPIIRHLTAAISGSEPLNAATLGSLVYKGHAIDVSAIMAAWEACDGRPGPFLRPYGLWEMFFTGKGVSRGMRDQLARVWDEMPRDVDASEFVFEELSGAHYTLFGDRDRPADDSAYTVAEEYAATA